LRIDKIKYEEIEKFLSDYLEKVNKNREIRQFGGYNKLLRILKSMFNLMVERGRIDYFKMPKTQKAQKINYDVLTLDEIDILLPEIEQRYGLERAVMVAMGCFLGLRVSEITNSQYSDINWNTKEFTNKQTKAKESKGIPIPNQMLELFKRIQTATPKLKTGTEYLFLTETGKLYPRNHVDFPLKHLGQALFEKHLTPHSLRRSYITILEIGGVSLGIIQGLARHETPEQTMAYVKIGMKDRVKAVDDIFNKRHA
jgi:integrase